MNKLNLLYLFLKFKIQQIIICALLLLIFTSNKILATTYYSCAATDPRLFASWTDDLTCTGANPANFTTAGDIFIVQAAHDLTMGNNWTIGANVTLQIDGILRDNNKSLVTGGDIILNGTLYYQKATTWTGNNWSGNGTINIGGGNPTLTLNPSTATVTFNGSPTINIKITITDATTVSNNGNITLNNVLNGGGGTATWLNNNGSTLNYSVAGTPMATGLLDVDAASNLVKYTATNNLTIKTTNYYNLTIAITTAKTASLGGAVVVGNNLTISSGILDPVGNDLTVDGTTTISGGNLSDSNIGGNNTLNDVSISSGNLQVNGANETFSIGGNLTMTGGSITAATANTTTVNVTGNLSVPSGTVAINGGSGTTSITITSTSSVVGTLNIENTGTVNYTATGATTISGTLSIPSTLGTKIFGGITVNTTGTWNNSGNSPITVNGSIQLNGSGAFTSGSGLYTLAGGANTISGTATDITITSALVTGVYELLSSITFIVPTLAVDGTFTNSSTCTIATSLSGTNEFIQGTNSTLNIGGAITVTTFTASTNCDNVVNYNGTAAQTMKAGNYCSLTVSNTNAITGATFGGVTSVANTFTVSSSGLATNSGQQITVTGNTAITGTFNITGAVGAKEFNNITVNAGGILNNSGNSDIVVNGDILNDDTFTSGSGTYTLQGGATKTISGSSGVNITNATVSGTYQVNSAGFTCANLTVSGSLSNNNVTTVSTSLSGVGTFTQLNGSIFNIGGTNTITTFDVDVNSNTVEYNGGGAQTVYSTTYHHLNKSGGGTATLGGDITVNGNISITSTGTLSADAAAYNITLLGNWSKAATATFTGNSGAGKVVFDGTVAQSTTGVTTFTNLEISNSNAAGVTLGEDITINTNLNFVQGNINTGSYYVKIPSGVTVTNPTNGHVYGYLQKYISAGGADVTFEVGGSSTDYTPVIVNITAGFVAGYLVCSSSNSPTEHGDVSSSDIDASKNINRYWKIRTSDGDGDVTFTNIDITFNFLDADKDGGINPPDFEIQKYDGTSWYDVTETDQFANSIKLTNGGANAVIAGITKYDFIVGHRINPDYIYNATTGPITWNNQANWIKARSGKISTDGVTTTVTGDGTTLFTTELSLGDVLILSTSPTTIIGTINTITNNNILDLNAPAALYANVDFGKQTIPNNANDIVYIGNPLIAVANTDVTLDMNPSIFRLIFNDMACANTLTHAAANSLTLGSNVTVKQPTNANTNLWDIAGGSATVGGNLNIGSSVAAVGQIAEVNIIGGSITLNNNLIFSTTTASDALLDLSAGGGRVYLKGNISLNSDGTINPGSLGSIFDYCGTSKNQTVVFTGNPTYYNLYFNNTYASGSVTLGSNLTKDNVTGNVIVQTGKFFNGGYSIDAITLTTTFEVDNGAYFRMTGNSVFPTNFNSYDMQTGSYTQYYQDNAGGTDISLQIYGYLESKPQTNGRTHYFVNGTTTINNNLTIGDATYSGTTDINTNDATVTVLGDIIIDNLATLIADGVGGTGYKTLTLGGNWTNNGGTFTTSNGNIQFNCTDNKAINGSALSQTLYNVELALTAGKTLSVGGSTTTLTVNNFTETTGNFTGPTTMTVNNNLVQSAGTFTGGTTMTISGTAQFNGGTHNAATTQTITGTATINTDGTIFTGGTTLTLNDVLTCNDASTFTTATTTDINANVVLNSTSSLVGGTTINFSGATWTNNGGAFDGTTNSNTIVFDNNAAQLITGTANAETFYNCEIAITGGNALTTNTPAFTTLTVNDLTMTTGNFTPPATLAVNDDFTQSSGTYTGNTLVTVSDVFTLDGGTFTAGATTTVVGNFIMNAGTYTAGANLNVGGNWDYNGGTFTPGTNTVTFNGSVDQTLDGVMSFYNLTMGQSVTAKKLTLNSTVTVTNSLTMTTGLISTTTNSLTLGTAATAASVGDADSYVDGPLIKNVLGGALGPVTNNFPVGKGTAWRPLELTYTHLGGCPAYSYTAEVFNTAPPAMTLPGTVDKVTSIRYYSVSRTDPSNKLSSATIAVYYGADDGVNDDPNLTILKSNSGETAWLDLNQGAIGGGKITCGADAITSFSKFALGNKNGGTNPLPIELLNFEAKAGNNIVDINWSTASEINNDYFTIEKSVNGEDVVEVTKVKGAINSSTILKYSAIDENPFTGISFYRLKQTDFDGKFTYSNWVAVNFDQIKEFSFDIYPNPVLNNQPMYLKMSGTEKNKDVLVVVRDVLGNEMYSKVFIVDESSESVFAIDTQKKLASGVYLIIGSSNNKIYYKKIVIK